MEVADFAAESIIIYDLQGTLRYCNPASELLYGWPRNTMIGCSIKSLIASAHLDASMWPQLQAVGSWAGVVGRRSFDGREVEVNLRLNIRLDTEGNPVDVVEYSAPAVVHTLPAAGDPVVVTGCSGRAACRQFDITQLTAHLQCPDTHAVRVVDGQRNSHDRLLGAVAINAVPELEASQLRYRNILSSLPVPVWEIDIRGMGHVFDRIRASGVTDMASYSLEYPEIVELACRTVAVSDANKEAVALFGAGDRTELLGPVDYFFAESPAVARRMMLAHFEGNRNFVEELKVRKKDGQLIDILLLCTFPTLGEQLDSLILMAIDISARVESEGKLRQMESDFTHAARLSTLGEMTASIAHEIKQPLSAILMNAQTTMRYLTRPDPNVEKACLLISRVIESSQRANDIIGRIREMAGKHLPTRERLDINDVVRNCLLFLRHETDDQAVIIQTSLEEDLPLILGDKVQLQQIVVNLIINSLQAMKQGPRSIILKTYWHEIEGVVCSIEDSGSGIDESHIGQIFDGFFTTKSDGIGIGLAICQTIARAHGGEIIASNVAGSGAMFRFNIPVYFDEVDEVKASAVCR